VPGRCVSIINYGQTGTIADSRQLFCAIIVTAMAGNNIARATNGTHSIVNYTLFVGVWWLFTLLYFLPTSFIEKFSIPIVDMAMDGLSVLFGFCAAVALPAYLGAHSCSNRVSLPVVLPYT
jgi:hypothetical protein